VSGEKEKFCKLSFYWVRRSLREEKQRNEPYFRIVPSIVALTLWVYEEECTIGKRGRIILRINFVRSFGSREEGVRFNQ